MRRLVVVSLVVLAVGCTGDPSGDPTPSPTPEPRYSVVDDDTFDGVEFPGTGYPRVDDWVTFGGTPVGNDHGSMMLFRRGTGAGREDLIVMYTQSPERLGVHGLRLTGDTSGVHLDLVCPGEAAVLVPGASLSPTYGSLDEGIRAWRPGPHGMLEEFDPAAAESTGTC